ncbi:DUF3857 domain-containing protein [Algoriphagus sp. AK58]|uniref:DUF3857 domain-containing protein n=1 Tax=Algoriphagus sp. AK58 TaxID=1406877 RepID=UPI0016509793|nr:DUF3857 domain-containing protein [Algoriphagus sp. AK58]MBC6365540.1 hypothetical protein [Algoriphagus sp. AK58]
MKSFIVGVFALFLAVNPAKNEAQEVKWGQYSPLELELETVPFQPEAKVVSLYEEGNSGLIWEKETYRVFGIYTTYYFRYKVLDDNVGNFGDFVIPFFQAGDFNIESIRELEAQVSYLEDGERKVYQLSDDNIKLVEMGDGYWQYRIVFPHVVKGSILEYRYLKTDRVYYSLEGWIFQGEQPKLRTKYTFEVPDFLQYQLIVAAGRVKDAMSMTPQKDKFFWELRNVPSFKVEPYISSPMDYLERVEGFLSVDRTQNPTVLYSTWEKLGEQIMARKEYGTYQKPISYKNLGFKEDVFIDSSKEAIARNIYEYISENFEEEPTLYPLPSKGVSELIRTKKGNHMDLNLLLIAALRVREIEAELILINQLSPLSRSYLIPSPNLDQFTSSLVRVKIGEGEWYLDPTDSKLPFGLLPLDKYVEKGFLISSGQSNIIALSHQFQSGTELDVTLGLDSIGQLQFHEHLKMTDLTVLAVMESLKAQVNEELKADGKPEPYNITFEDHFRKDRYFVSNFNLSIREEENGMVVLDPFTFSGFSENPFTDDSRLFDIEFGFPMKEKMKFSFQIPEGYQLDELPQPTTMELEKDGIYFSYLVSQENQIIIIETVLDIRRSSHPAKRYNELKRFFEIVSQALSYPIILMKNVSP